MTGRADNDTSPVSVSIRGQGLELEAVRVALGRQLGSLLPAGKESSDFAAGRLTAVDALGRHHSYTEELSQDLELRLELSYEGMLPGGGAFLLCIMAEGYFRRLDALIGTSGCEAFPCHSREDVSYFEKKLAPRLKGKAQRVLVVKEYAERLGLRERDLRSLTEGEVGYVRLQRPAPQPDFKRIAAESSLAFQRDFGLCLQDDRRIQRSSLAYGLSFEERLRAYLISVDCAHLVNPGDRSSVFWLSQGYGAVGQLRDLYSAPPGVCSRAAKVFNYVVETVAESSRQDSLCRERLLEAHLSPKPLALALGVI